MLGEERVVEYEVQFRSAGGNAGTSFAQLGVGVLSTLVETNNGSHNDRRALEVGNAALYPVQTNTNGLLILINLSFMWINGLRHTLKSSVLASLHRLSICALVASNLRTV